MQCALKISMASRYGVISSSMFQLPTAIPEDVEWMRYTDNRILISQGLDGFVWVLSMFNRFPHIIGDQFSTVGHDLQTGNDPVRPSCCSVQGTVQCIMVCYRYFIDTSAITEIHQLIQLNMTIG